MALDQGTCWRCSTHYCKPQFVDRSSLCILNGCAAWPTEPDPKPVVGPRRDHPLGGRLTCDGSAGRLRVGAKIPTRGPGVLRGQIEGANAQRAVNACRVTAFAARPDRSAGLSSHR